MLYCNLHVFIMKEKLPCVPVPVPEPECHSMQVQGSKKTGGVPIISEGGEYHGNDVALQQEYSNSIQASRH